MTLVSPRRADQSSLVTAKKKPRAGVGAPAARDPKTFRARRLTYDLADPITHDRAVAEIVEALTEARGNAVHAAAALCVSHRALLDWIAATPALAGKLAAIRVLFDHSDRRAKP